MRSIYKLAGVAESTYTIKVFTFLYRLVFALKLNHPFVIWRKFKFYIFLGMNVGWLLVLSLFCYVAGRADGEIYRHVLTIILLSSRFL